MQTTKDPLDGLLEDIERRICEARALERDARRSGFAALAIAYNKAERELVELRDAHDRRMDEAAERGETFGGGSLQRVGRLRARWRAQAATMEELALDSTDDSQDQIECYERMRTLRDCAEALERELAGTEPTVPRELPEREQP